MKKSLLIALLVTGLLATAPVFAADLHQARHEGAVGEKNDGYVAALKSTPEIQALVQTVNQKRRQEYAHISAENSQPVDVVAKLAAQQIIETLSPGDKYQDASGHWQTR